MKRGSIFLLACWREKIGRVSQGLLVLSRGRVIVQDVPAIIFAGHQQSKQSGVVSDRGMHASACSDQKPQPILNSEHGSPDPLNESVPIFSRVS
jgi:hypothetical protein